MRTWFVTIWLGLWIDLLLAAIGLAQTVPPQIAVHTASRATSDPKV